MPASLIARALKTCDMKILQPKLVGSLISICPSETDLKAVLEYDGERNLFANPEKFVEEMSKIPAFKIRLKAFNFIHQYNELFDDLCSKISCLTQLFKSMR